MRVALEPDGSGGFILTMQSRKHFGDGSFDLFQPKDPEFDQEFIRPSVSDPALMLRHAEAWLELLPTRLDNQTMTFGFLCNFLAYLRAVPDTLERSCQNRPGFTAWWEEQNGQLSRNAAVERTRSFRNRILHQGSVMPIIGREVDFMEDLDGRPWVEYRNVLLQLDGDQTVDALSTFREALEAMKDLVRAGEALGFPPVWEGTRCHAISTAAWKQQADGTWKRVEMAELDSFGNATHVPFQPTRIPGPQEQALLPPRPNDSVQFAHTVGPTIEVVQTLKRRPSEAKSKFFYITIKEQDPAAPASARAPAPAKAFQVPIG